MEFGSFTVGGPIDDDGRDRRAAAERAPGPAAVPVATGPWRPRSQPMRANERCDVAAPRPRPGRAAKRRAPHRATERTTTMSRSRPPPWRSPTRARPGGEGERPGRRSGAPPRVPRHGRREGAARDWLNEVNRINREAREATRLSIVSGPPRPSAATLERLALEADTARITAGECRRRLSRGTVGRRPTATSSAPISSAR